MEEYETSVETSTQERTEQWLLSYGHKFYDEEVRHIVLIEKPGGLPILLINREHESFREELDPVLSPLLRDRRCRAFVPEYFVPELRRNAMRSGLVAQAYNFLFPDESFEDDNFFGKRGTFFLKHAELMKSKGKCVVVVDIANNYQYEAYFTLWPSLPSLLALGLPLPPQAKTSIILGTWGTKMYNMIAEGIGTGIYDKENLHWYEKLVYDLEDARRLHASWALQRLSLDYSREYPEGNFIVACYPTAHAKRILRYMTPHNRLVRILNIIKKITYHFPGLDFSLRTYKWKDSLANASNEANLASWQLVSRTPCK